MPGSARSLPPSGSNRPGWRSTGPRPRSPAPARRQAGLRLVPHLGLPARHNRGRRPGTGQGTDRRHRRGIPGLKPGRQFGSGRHQDRGHHRRGAQSDDPAPGRRQARRTRGNRHPGAPARRRSAVEPSRPPVRSRAAAITQTAGNTWTLSAASTRPSNAADERGAAHGRSAPPGTPACPVAARDRNPGPRRNVDVGPPAAAGHRGAVADMTHAGKDAPWRGRPPARPASSTWCWRRRGLGAAKAAARLFPEPPYIAASTTSSPIPRRHHRRPIPATTPSGSRPTGSSSSTTSPSSSRSSRWPSPRSRAGVSRRLRGKLRDIVTAATEQVTASASESSTMEHSGRSRRMAGRERRPEVQRIAVGLEDLWRNDRDLAAGACRRLGSGHIPWTVSVHDLRIICELTERPASCCCT